MKYACTITHKSGVVKIVLAPLVGNTDKELIKAAEDALKAAGLYDTVFNPADKESWTPVFADMWPERYGDQE